MKLRNIILGAACLSTSFAGYAQEIDNTLSFKNLNTDNYFRINYENDYFAATDQYYTQGFSFELVDQWMKNFPLSKALVHPKFNKLKYGLAVEHNGYTPTSIGSDAILYNDRPFAADVSLKSFVIAIDTTRKQRFTTTLSVGIIGPGAGGKEMQTYIHKNTHNATPHGWDNQVQNDLLLNYQVDYQKQLLAYRNIFSLSGDAVARIGTVNDKAALGLTMMIGYFDSPYGVTAPKESVKKHFRMYAYEHPMFQMMAYDATLQGGLFNKNSPYVIANTDLKRVLFENRFGFVVNYQRLYLEYFQSVRSNEFTTSRMSVWGGIQVAFGI
ncbi:MAG: lipid deacylase LpxR family protein [Flavipsychrobacter sp.]|nr:lipid deacylase LpxR family protein [Flavipsychrobacter sp.]